MDISNFRISGQSLIKENCHNSRTSDDIDMKLGPVTKLDKKTKTMTSGQKIVMLLSFFGFLVNLEQSGGQIPDRVWKSYVFSNSNLLSYKNCKQN